MVLEIDSVEQFDEILKDSSLLDKHGKKYILVDFFAMWCGPCLRFSPTLDQLSKTYGEEVFFVKVDVDKVSELTERYLIRSLPTFMVFDSGSLESTYEPIIGASKEKLEQRLKYLSSSKTTSVNAESFDF